MTYLLDDSGNEIVLNTEVTVTKQVISFFNFKIKGNFSKNFGIPNTSATRRALGYYGVNQSEKVAFSNQAWNLYKDGNLLTRGYVVIQTENEDELDCFFASGNASWINTLSGNLADMNWSDYDQTFSDANLSTLRTATTGMVFPLADWGYNTKKLQNDFVISEVRDSANEPTSFIVDFYPAFYLKTIVKEIAKQRQIKISGNIFQDATFDKMVIPLPGIQRYLEEAIYMTDNDTYAGNQYIGAGATNTVTFAYESYSNSLLDLTNGRIQAGNKSVNVRVRIAFTFDSAFTGNVLLRRNGVTEYTLAFATSTFLRYQTVSLATNDYLDVQVQNTSGATRSITDKYFGYEVCGSWYEYGLKVLAKDVVPKMKIVDVLKYVVQAFNCIVTFDDFSRTILLNKIDSVRKEDAVNLTSTVIDYEIDWQNDFARSNYIRTNQTTDLDKFNKQDLGFGEFVFDGPDNGKAQDDVFQLKLGPSLTIRQQDSFGLLLPYIPLFNLVDDGDPIAYTSTSSGGSGLTTFNGLTEQLADETIIRIDDDSDLNTGYIKVQSSTGTTVTVKRPFVASSTGFIRKQKINFPISAGFRVLINNPNYTVANYAKTSSITIGGPTSYTSYTTYPVAYYYVPVSEYTISQSSKLGAHPGEINNTVSIPLSTQYYRRLQKIARNPLIKVTFRLSETQFNTLNLAEFIYLDIGRWSGYFFIQKIDGYKDSITDVKAEVLKVD